MVRFLVVGVFVAAGASALSAQADAKDGRKVAESMYVFGEMFLESWTQADFEGHWSKNGVECFRDGNESICMYAKTAAATARFDDTARIIAFLSQTPATCSGMRSAMLRRNGKPTQSGAGLALWKHDGGRASFFMPRGYHKGLKGFCGISYGYLK